MNVKNKVLIALAVLVMVSLATAGAFFYGLSQGKAKCELAQATEVIRVQEKVGQKDEVIERETPRNKATEDKLRYILDHAVDR